VVLQLQLQHSLVFDPDGQVSPELSCTRVSLILTRRRVS